jgi:hypothetical protein
LSFKLNLKTKIRLDSLLKKLLSTIRDNPVRLWLDKGLTRELLDMTDFKHMQVRDLHLYIRPLDGKIVEAVVLDNELAICHTSMDDIAIGKSPYWQEVFSIPSIRKIMNDKDVIISKGKESLKRLHVNVLALLDPTYAQDDMLLLEDARLGLDQNPIVQIQ